MLPNDENRITVSVILPVFNVESLIADCIESLKRQDQDGLEFIFVDDCSTDGSLAIIEDFAKEDPRVKIVRNEKNMGAGCSRNRGIAAARGDYLSFIDPDDWISDNFYKTLYEKALKTGCDIVKGTRIAVDESSTVGDTIINKPEGIVNSMIKKSLEGSMPLYQAFNYEHTTAIYKSSLFSDGELCYGSSGNSQDVTFLLKVCCKAEGIALDESAVYYYRQREGAATKEYTLRRAINEIESLEESASFLKDKTVSDSMISYLRTRILKYYNTYYYAYRDEELSENDNNEYHKYFKQVIEQIGCTEKVLRNLPEVDAFMKYGHIIPLYTIKDKELLRDSIKRWREFLEIYTDEAEEKHYRAFALAICRYSDFVFEENKTGRNRTFANLRFFAHQLNRLKLKDRAKVIRYIRRHYRSAARNK